MLLLLLLLAPQIPLSNRIMSRRNKNVHSVFIVVIALCFFIIVVLLRVVYCCKLVYVLACAWQKCDVVDIDDSDRAESSL